MTKIFSGQQKLNIMLAGNLLDAAPIYTIGDSHGI